MTEKTADIWQLGKIYLIRTVTMIDTGRLVAIGAQQLVLEDAAWIAATGRFASGAGMNIAQTDSERGSL